MGCRGAWEIAPSQLRVLELVGEQIASWVFPKIPGAIVATLIPSLPKSLAMGSVIPTTPAFDAL